MNEKKREDTAMLGRLLLTGTIATTLSACAILEPLEGKSTKEGYFATKSVAEQDPYWQRFYALEREIAALKASNARLQQQMAPTDSVYTAPAPLADVSVQEDSSVETVLGRVREQADRAIAAIDRAMASLADAPATAEKPVVMTAQINIPDIQGNLTRNEEGEVVKQTTYAKSQRHRYNYSVVYVYPETQPWNDMWAKLEQAEEQDKWRGFNPSRTRYFIYVGAYYNEMDAQQRQESLFALVGERPNMRERAQNHALAAK